ncbi:hypothetical protein IGI47_002681 [Enterococcus sp. AZ191]|uniref:DUF3991 domain-containing protein n=1 Tax=Enterococcus sp. AZ191 TaxID=2774639 RepID=UPI003F21AAE2
MPSAIDVFTEKQIAYARRTNMFKYMLARGEDFDVVSSKFVEHTVHDSLRANIKTGVVNWYSKGLTSWNNSIDFAMQFFNEPYEQVVQSLLDFQKYQRVQQKFNQKWNEQEKKIAKNKKPDFSLEKLTETGNYDTNQLSEKGKEYLKNRFFSEETINMLAQRKLISSDNRNNIIFRFSGLDYGNFGKPVGADVQGTYERPLEKRINYNNPNQLELERKYFKGVALNSQENYGFLFGCECSYKQDVTLYVTESPIESMSLYELTKDSLPDNSWFLSLSGLKEETMWATVNKLQDYLLAPRVQVVLALNNDTRGRECIEKIHQEYLKKKEASQFDERVKLSLFLPDLENGDWNEILELKETGQLASRQEKIKEKQLAQMMWAEKISQQMETTV